MKANYFTNCKSIEELKKEYRRLSKINHPDCGGGSESAMKEISNAYDFMFNILRDVHNSKAENADNQNTEQPEAFRNIINELMKFNNLEIEICGSWIWVSGNTFAYKAELNYHPLKWVG